MLEIDLDVVGILPVTNSHLELEVTKLGLPAFPVSSKEEAIYRITNSKFDILISCGFPFILPISKFHELLPSRRFINIHPSYLPDLRGADPIPGAILHGRDSGVSCHLMDDGVDTGDLITQRHLPYSKEWDAASLYQLCFSLEGDIFCEALESNFKPKKKQFNQTDGTIYYSFKPDDLIIDGQLSNDQIISRIRAFNSTNKGARIYVNSSEFRVFEGNIIPRPSSSRLFFGAANNEIVASFNDSILVSRKDSLLRLGKIDPLPSASIVGGMIY
jgi:methionyl-tRNA formyltransferase